MNLKQINIRYSDLAEGNCCLSCGGAVDHSKLALGEICVDLGSGRGTDVFRMAEEVGDEGFVYGIDISDGMLEKSLKTNKKLGYKNVKFIKSPLEELPIESNTVDLVVSNCTINHSSGKQMVWNEIYRILKNKGRAIVSDIYAIEEVPEDYRNDPDAVAECWAGAVTREHYLDQLTRAGFNSPTILEESKPYDKGKIKVSSWTIQCVKKICCCS